MLNDIAGYYTYPQSLNECENVKTHKLPFGVTTIELKNVTSDNTGTLFSRNMPR
jgi:hypothetical protein